jgi:hypothetical protein
MCRYNFQNAQYVCTYSIRIYNRVSPRFITFSHIITKKNHINEYMQKKMANRYHHRRRNLNRLCLFISAFILGYLIVVILSILSYILRNQRFFKKSLAKYQLIKKQVSRPKSNYIYENFIQWNRTLCSKTSDDRVHP